MSASLNELATNTLARLACQCECCVWFVLPSQNVQNPLLERVRARDAA